MTMTIRESPWTLMFVHINNNYVYWYPCFITVYITWILLANDSGSDVLELLLSFSTVIEFCRLCNDSNDKHVNIHQRAASSLIWMASITQTNYNDQRDRNIAEIKCSDISWMSTHLRVPVCSAPAWRKQLLVRSSAPCRQTAEAWGAGTPPVCSPLQSDAIHHGRCLEEHVRTDDNGGLHHCSCTAGLHEIQTKVWGKKA